ncbi:AAA domain-containing protein [Pyronema omphalodes]|nr:AAA domain-containing protein [Pyronema omphalodes]
MKLVVLRLCHHHHHHHHRLVMVIYFGKDKLRFSTIRVYFPVAMLTLPKINKLAILGIRSFDPTRNEVIKFDTPLTLIVGQNGCGKTTIIECLKYATTGDLPPNSKGGAFIHDPKMCGEREVLGQIKLSFDSINGAQMVCTRSMQLTVKKTSRSMKTLDGQLLVVRNGERSTISSRCAELDTVMPQYLGVSKAVLEYVIFCHQDESLWPLSEPAALKKRFDEIFEAQKYTKAITNLKDLVKAKNIELGKMRILLDQYRTDKDRAEKAKRRADELHNEIEEMRTQITSLSSEIASISAQQEAHFLSAREFESILATLEMKRQAAISKRSHLSELSQHMLHLSESTPALLQMQSDYTSRLSSFTATIESKKQQHTRKTLDLENLRLSLGSKMTEKGRLEAEKKQFETLLSERAAMIKEIAISHNIRGFDSAGLGTGTGAGSGHDETLVTEFLTRISRLSRDQNHLLETLKRQNEETITSAKSSLDSLLSKHQSFSQKKSYSQSESQSLDQKIRSLQRELEAMGLDTAREGMMKEELRIREQRFEELKMETQGEGLEREIAEGQKRLREVEERIEEMQQELWQGNRDASARAQLEVLQQGVEVKRKALAQLLEVKRGRIDEVLGEGWNEGDVERRLKGVVEQREEELQKVTRLREAQNQELAQVTLKIDIATDSLKRMKAEADKCKETVLGSWFDETVAENQIEDYHDALRDLEEQRKQFESAEFFTKYLLDALSHADHKDACKLCLRSFDATEKSKFKEIINKRMSKLITSATAETMASLDAEIADLKNAGPFYDTYMRLTTTEIPTLEKEMLALRGGKEKVLADCNIIDQDYNHSLALKSTAESLKTPISDLSRLHREIQTHETEIRDLHSSLLSTVGLRSPTELQDLLKTLQDQAKTLKATLRTLESDREARRQNLILAERQVNDARKRLSELQLQLMESQNLVERIEEYSAEKKRLRGIMEEAEEDIRKLAPAIQMQEARVGEAVVEAQEREMRQQREAGRVAQADIALRSIQQRVERYVNEGGLERLQGVTREVQELQKRVEEMVQELGNGMEEIRKMEREHNMAGTTQRSIQENLRWRKNKEELEEIEKEIKELEGKDAETKKEQFTRDANTLANTHMRLSSEKSTLVGSLKTKDAHLLQLQADFLTDYSSAKTNYKTTLAEVHILQAIISDLTKYSRALDLALMKYHTLKMREINSIISELWTEVYRGSDIDTILIRSESSPSSSEATTRLNSSTNYRVCMVKSDVEMDMRGRCSAGQRILACIIIRLALAECFGVNCGLIALDEPTTNLDRENVRSLALALNRMVKSRMRQRNFMAIVITHDEEFLREMRVAEFVEGFYRVRRNTEGASIIERGEVRELMY